VKEFTGDVGAEGRRGGYGEGLGELCRKKDFFFGSSESSFFSSGTSWVVFLVEFMKYTKKNVGSKMAKLQTLFLKS